MTRRATAVLEVQVQDSQLDAHLEKLDQVRAAWTFIGGNLSELTKSFSKGTGDELAKVSKAIAAMANVKSGGGAASVVEALARAKPNLAGLATELEKVQEVTNKLSNDSVRWARALTKAAAEVARLEKHTDSLISSQERTSTHMKEFEEHLDKTTTKLRTQGKEMLQLIQAYAGFNKAAKAAGGGSGGGKNNKDTVEGFWESVANFERGFIRHATTLFITGQWIKSAADSFRDAAVQLDLERVLVQSLTNFSDLMEKTREATRGAVSDLQILKSSALMSSFGIPMENFAENMALVQKMSVRTGQDVTYMFDSLARGVSRLSPAILDNLGIQIKLKEAYEAGALAAGTGVDSLDKQGQKIAVLNEVMRQMRDLTQNVDPAASMQSRIEQMEATWTNFTQKMKGMLLNAIMFVASTEEERLAISKDQLAILIRQREEYEKMGKEGPKENNTFITTGTYSQKHLETRVAAMASTSAMQINAMANGYENVRDYVLDVLEAEGVLYQTRGRSTAELKRMEILQAKRIRDERNLGNITSRAAAALSDLRDVQEDMGSFDWNKHLSALQDLPGAARRNNLFSATEREMRAAFDALDAYKKHITDMKADNPFDEARVSLFKDKAIKAIDEIARNLRVDQTNMKGDGILAEKFLGKGGASWIIQQISGVMQAADKSSTELSRASAEKRRAEIAVLATLDSSVALRERDFALLQGSTIVSLEFERAQKAVKEAQSEYNKLREDSIVAGEGELSTSNKMLQDADAKLKLAQEEYAFRLQSKELEDLFQTYMNAGKNGAKELRDMEFQRLAGGRSRAQLELEMLNLSKQLLAVEKIRQQVSFETTEAEFMALAVKAIEAGRLEDAIARIQKLLALNPLKGGGRSAKEKKEKIRFSEEFEYEPDDIKRSLMEFTEGPNGVANIYLRMFKDTASGVFKQIKEDSAVFQVDNGGEGKGLLGNILFGGQNFAEALNHNEEIIEMIQNLVNAYGLEMTPAIIEYLTALDKENDKLRDHLGILRDVSEATKQWDDANQWAWQGAQGLIGQDFIDGFTGLGTAIQDVSQKLQDAMSGEANGYDVMLAGMGGIRAFTSAFIKDRRDRAKVEALMNGAAAFAAAGYGNWPAAAAHAQAAIMYGLVAGGRVRLPSESRKDSKDAEAKTTGGPLHIHVYNEFSANDAEKGEMVERVIAEARANGRL